MTWYFYVGLLAALCISIYCLPQLIYVVKSKNTTGISIWMLFLMLAGDLLFVTQAIGIWVDKANKHNIDVGLPLFLANFFALIVGSILLTYKLRNRKYAKLFNVTEKTYCENYDSYKTKRKMMKAEKAAAKRDEISSRDKTPPITAGE